MFVLKRSGERQRVELDKITQRIALLCAEPAPALLRADPVLVASKVVAGLYCGVSTRELDDLAIQTAASLTTLDPQYTHLAARIAVSNLHKSTPPRFSEAVAQLASYTHPATGARGVLSEELAALVAAHAAELDAAIVPERDFSYTFLGFKTLERAYLLRCGEAIVERPGYMLLRVALGVHGADIAAAVRMYESMSRKLYTAATPTLFNSGTARPAMASCFLLSMEDSIEGIYKTLSDCARISKHSGGIGLHCHDVRAAGSHIAGTGGRGNGLVPMLRVFNASARFVDQGGGRRPGSIAVYLEPHHPDILAFLQLRRNSGNELERARDLFTALWVSDLFMQRAEAGAQWSLFCPSECPGLSDVYGADFERLYCSYESAGRARAQLPARDVFNAMVASQIETGTPYVLFKDACNRKSNQRASGVLKSSNLCSEILEISSASETAVCNLASINVSAFVLADTSSYDFEALAACAGECTFNLNRVVDRTYYATEEARASNLLHRPLGLGVQGLADAFMQLRLPFDSEAAAALSAGIAEAVYFGALTESCRLAQQEGGAYGSFVGSPFSEGLLQFHLWDGDAQRTAPGRFDWAGLTARIQEHGTRNSLLTAQMPTASTSCILGRTESVEPLSSNVYVRRTSAGEFVVLNEYLVEDLLQLGLWTPALINQLIADEGSVQALPGVPPELKALYRTVWELKQRVLVEQAADRGRFLDQSQSMNLFLAEPSLSKITSMLFHGWKSGLKTGMYYLRTRPKAAPIKFSVDAQAAQASRAAAAAEGEPLETAAAAAAAAAVLCRRSDPEGCAACSA